MTPTTSTPLVGRPSRPRRGDPLVLDALAGRLCVRPPPVVEREYQRHEADLEAHRALLKESLHLTAQAVDGVAIKLSANIGKITDASAALEVNAVTDVLRNTKLRRSPFGRMKAAAFCRSARTRAGNEPEHQP